MSSAHRRDHTDARLSSSLSTIAEDAVLATLRERYLSSKPYTLASPSVLISVNPHTYLPVNSDSSLQNHVAEYYRSSVDEGTSRDAAGSTSTKGKRDPHVFQLASNALYNMRRTRQDQIILMS